MLHLFIVCTQTHGTDDSWPVEWQKVGVVFFGGGGSKLWCGNWVTYMYMAHSTNTCVCTVSQNRVFEIGRKVSATFVRIKKATHTHFGRL